MDEEKTRPYWKKSFKVEIEDNSQALKDKEKQVEDKEKADRVQEKAILDSLKSFKALPDKKIEDVSLAVQNLIEFLRIK